ncbi:Penicillin-binding protein 2 [Kingella denitrificans]|uniref:Penicillin-binding protein, transpeptidase domain protein n=1 Tax=Kingella denitrificans ATCC 33394 TaxID=888741 RepID=F0EVX1_9NEIS|nr:penicillin-binding protein 2 [Kingella denitrificans]EGC18556.1 penicillin-binding protein, transpeptidase domain protein [Kingella denitrificans ATCC 33394]QQB42826.1 penicillin-binding protein 2 [Kingella denitrificans]STR11201.1 Penicillin-binding protein 2 [Kingella denitrificans]
MLIRNEHKPYMAYKKEEKIQPALKSNYRLPTLFGAISAVFVGLIGYSFFVQEKYHQELSSSSEARLVRTIREPALRGAIVDRNGTILAVSRYLKIATFNPRAIYAPKRKGDTINWNTISDAQFRQLAEVLQVPEAEVRAKLQNLSSQYVQFKTELSLEDADKLKALGIPTLHFEERTERSYPTGNLFSHIVGFANSKGQGLEGLELSQNKTLTGEDGKQVVLRDRHRNVIELVDSPENVVAKSGETVTLSLDYNMQRLAREQLQAALTQFKAKAGGAVVLDAQTGEVLAMSSLPDYDANHYGEYPVESRRNFTVGVTIEPGSVMKPFIVAKALDDGKINRNTWFNTSAYELANKRISDTHEYGSLNTEGILQKSSNVGVSKIAAMYDNQTLYNYLSAIGFGRKTQSGVVGEQSAALKAANRWSRLDKAVMSYGYAITANLLQMAQGYTIFTTDGRLQPATIFKQPNPQKGEVILQPETARKMREMMISVTQKGGTGQAGAVPGYDVAGKTGTARKAINGRYEGKYVASFVGFAPAKNPRLIVAVSIDEPVGSYYGGTVAGPVFRGIMEGGLKLLNVAPTYVNADKTVQTAQR